MTLDTRIYIYDPVDQREVFDLICSFLGIPEQREVVSRTGSPYGCTPAHELSNVGGQGFSAWVMTYASPDLIRYTDEYKASRAEDHDKYCPPGDDCGCTPEHRAGPHYMQVSMDTGYGYRGENGEGCTVLHARVVYELGTWLDAHGVRWAWENEYNGEISHGLDQDAFMRFLGNGVDADKWFREMALPAITKEMEERK